MSDTSSYQVFAERMMQKDSELIPEILQCMITDDQAKLLISLPGTSDEMAEKLNRPVNEIDLALKDMFRKGLVFKKEKGGITQWRPPAHLAQFHDGTILWPEAPPKFYDLWRDYMDKEWPDLANVLVKFMPRPFTRVVPVGKSIETGKVQVLAPESIRKIIESSSRIAVTKCTCRLTMRKCDAPVEVCLQINRGADYTIERGTGREVSKEEAFDIIDKTEEAGLVHVTMNKSGVGHFICNCCGCCCQSFTLLISDRLSLCDPSRYRPEVDPQACTSCGICEDRCWFGAIKADEKSIASVIEEKCLGCGQCATGCPENAITMTEIREPGFIPE
ncbi:MAG: 4Fe-4S ferredoxin [Desulfobacteraceae bacterium]|nr:MAG: 4Fe-4S ferredoxin [Desulfobacteraceae bacterium]